jgi:hypothetical protein
MKIIYRISDGGNIKNKPAYVTKKGVFHHFYKIFKDHDIYVVGDNISNDTYLFLCKYIDHKKIIKTSLGNAKSFIFAVGIAINLFSPEDKVYFCEDDYLYTQTASKILEEGLDISDYCTGYDHPDKYINTKEGGDNPLITEGGELTRVLITNSSHWKYTNSFCMTFATTVKILVEDIHIYEKYCQYNIPNDFYLFQELRSKGRKLVSTLPSISTHGETKYLAPFINWEQAINNTNYDFC